MGEVWASCLPHPGSLTPTIEHEEQSVKHKRFMLFRWHKRTQLDVRLEGRFLSLGLDRRGPRWRVIAYVSPDATPVHPAARGLKVGD